MRPLQPVFGRQGQGPGARGDAWGSTLASLLKIDFPKLLAGGGLAPNGKRVLVVADKALLAYNDAGAKKSPGLGA
jgi:hypothetical protein